MDGLFREGLPVRYLPKLLFVMLITLLYIGNTHYGNRMNRSIQRLKQETEDLRADYTTLKSDYMEASKQSEVARKVAALGMVESGSPPFRINVPAGHLDAAALELLPVLTADSLGARVARDSIAAQLADSLAGRRRRLTSEENTGPEIIAPPQADELDPDAAATAEAAAAGTAAGSRAVAKPAAQKGRSAAQKRLSAPLRASGKHDISREKLGKKASTGAKNMSSLRKSVQKSTTPHKKEAARSHPSTLQPKHR